VKKFWECSVKKENLFDADRGDECQGSLFSFSGIHQILAFFMSAAAFFAYFFLLQKKSRSQRSEKNFNQPTIKKTNNYK